jgi:tetratricopeptide (TPR) repeat protein
MARIMRTFQFPFVIGNSLLAGTLTLVTAAPLAAAEPASSVSFVNRDPLSATGTNGWRNPLRADTSADEAESGNSLRPTVTPVSYEADADAASPDGGRTRAADGLQLRPHTQPTGIFSGFVGEGVKPFAQARPAAASAQQSQFRRAQTQPAPPKSATQRALGMMPQFKSSTARKQAQVAASQATRNSRAGAALPHTAQSPTQRPTGRPAAQASYNTAASAQAYRHYSLSSRATATATTHPPNPNATPLSRPTMGTSRPTMNASHPTPAMATQNGRPRLSATPASPSSVAAASPVAILMQAHQLAETARSESDFSNIFARCQQIPASQATAEEAAFGRQLAAWSLNRRGQLRARSDNSEAAMADFALAIRIDAKCWRALHNRGVLLAQAGQFEPAFDDFHQTIELNPNFAKAFANRGALYVLAGELEPALADYQRAVELDPSFAVAHRGCGRACHMLGRIDEALEHLSRAIELAPQDAAALASRGDLLTDIGEYAVAADDYERALAVNPRYADACRGSAWLLATCPDGEVRNPGVALERAQKAVELERKADATTLDTLAAAQASVGDFQSATQSIRRAIELAPPSERNVYQDRMQMYRQSKPYRIEPLQAVQQAGFER